jgi:hypothetical protein
MRDTHTHITPPPPRSPPSDAPHSSLLLQACRSSSRPPLLFRPRLLFLPLLFLPSFHSACRFLRQLPRNPFLPAPTCSIRRLQDGTNTCTRFLLFIHQFGCSNILHLPLRHYSDRRVVNPLTHLAVRTPRKVVHLAAFVRLVLTRCSYLMHTNDKG